MIKYPYTINDLMNTDALARAIIDMQSELKNFVVTNAIKYANPIQWNITTQYEKNTVVIDPLTGTAYISVAPVPMGVSLSNTDYWTVVFNLSEFVTRAARNFSLNYEENTTLTATFPTLKGGWVVWNDTLYVANVNITPGDQYVDAEGGNITRITMESVLGNMDNLQTTAKNTIINAINEVVDLYTSLNDAIGDLNELTIPASSIVNALNAIATAINNIVDDVSDVDAKIGDLAGLQTEDKDNIVDAINSVLDDISATNTVIGNLADLQTEDKDNIVDAINENHLKIGDLDDLDTTIKDNIVAAINDIASIIPEPTPDNYVTPDMFGASGDNTTDDTNAINDAIAECFNTGKTLYFPNKIYKTTSTITIASPNFDIIMEGTIHYTGVNNALTITNMHYHTIKINLLGDFPTTTNDSGLLLDGCTGNNIYINKISNFNSGMTLGKNSSVAYNTFYIGSILNIHTGIHMDVTISSAWTNENIFIGGRFTNFSSAGIANGLIGVKTSANSGSHSPNNNIFIKPCMENSGLLDIGFDLTNCKGWSVINARFETARNPVKLTNCYGVKITGYDLYGTVTDDKIFNNNVKRVDYFNVDPLIPIFETEPITSCHYNANYGEYPEYCFNLDRSKGYVEEPVVTGDYLKVGTSVAIKFNVSSLKNKTLAWVFTGQSGDEYRTACRLIDDNNNIITTPPVNNNGFSLGTGDDGLSIFYDGGTSPITYLTKIVVPDNCKEIIIRGYINDVPRKLRTLKVFAEKEFDCVPIKTYQKGIPTKPTDSTLKGEYVNNTDPNTTIKGWYYNGSAWVDDYVYDPN